MGKHDKALAERARSQLGLITSTQLAEAHVGRQGKDARCRDGRLERIHPGVLQVGGTPPSWRQQLLAACLGAGPEAVASHRAAAVLHGFDGFSRAPLEVITRRSRNFFPPSVVIHRPVRFLVVDRTTIRGCADRRTRGPSGPPAIAGKSGKPSLALSAAKPPSIRGPHLCAQPKQLVPATSVAKTLIDLGAVVGWRRVEEALDGAIRGRRVSLAFLYWRLDAYAARGRPGVGVLRKLLVGRDHGPSPQSVLERRFLRSIAGLNLPGPELQFEIRDGRFLAVVDFAWPELRVVIEVDGHAFHATRQQRAHDSARQNGLAARGWLVLRFTYEQVVHEPAWVASQVLAAIHPLLVAQ